MAKSVKVNYIYNMLNTVTQMLFPVITFPYASRILMADGIGQVNFFSSIIQYVVLLSSLGIPLYAVRESARVRNDAKELSRVSMEIMLLHLILTVLGYLIIFILCFTVEEISSSLPLFLLLSTNIIFNAIGCHWLFQGVEDFKYITIRGLVVKAASLIALFLLVHTREDLLWYGAYTVIGTVGGNIFNLWRIRLYVKPRWHSFQELHPFRHLKPCLRIFALNLIISIYCNLDLVMLGFLKDNSAVGYYTGAHKIVHMLMGITTSLGTVMLPRLANLLAVGKTDEFRRLSQKAIDFIIMIATPLSLGLIAASSPIIHLFCGHSYEPSITTLQIIAPVILIIGLSNVMGIQILYPQGKEHLVMICTGIGAVLNCIINLCLIPTYGSDGAAIGTLIAESGVTISMWFIGKRYLNLRLKRQHLVVLFSALIMFGACLTVSAWCENDWMQVIIMPVVATIVYGFLLLVSKDTIAIEVMMQLKNKVIKR